MKSRNSRARGTRLVGQLSKNKFAKRSASAGTLESLETRRLMSLAPIATATGKVALSVDGLGTISGNGTVQVQKPSASATVRAAYLAAATTPTNPAATIADGAITLDGQGVTWTNSVPFNLAASSNGNNYFGNVTSLIKSKVDAASAGSIDIAVSEGSAPTSIDGEILAVIFDDPTQPTSNTVTLLFGAQAVAGDQFNVSLATPVNTSDPNLGLDLSLGISFGFPGGSQYSNVDVNNTRMTSSAGGNDDGDQANGALLTVGGVGDTNANPADPQSHGGSDTRYDDELYSLLPFVHNGDTSIAVKTANPSNDDNIFFGAFNLKGTSAIVGEGVLLSPETATKPVGTQHTVTATLKDNNGNAINNRSVHFAITSGPNAGASADVLTNSSGLATFTFTSATAGTDHIKASFTSSSGATITSNEATVTWTGEQTDSITYVLVNADSDTDIMTIHEGDTVNLALLPTRDLNIRAQTTPTGSMKLLYDNSPQTENEVPYSFFGDSPIGDYNVGHLAPGTHTLTGTKYSGKNLTGTQGFSQVLHFTVTDGVVQTFSLINADTNKVITGFDNLPNGVELNLATLPTRNLNIRANTLPNTVGSVQFDLDGAKTLETAAPYALYGDDTHGDYYAGTPSVGGHVLKATPFIANNGMGLSGQAKTLNFTVVDRAITSFMLYNADTNLPIRTLNNGDVINTAVIGTRNLNIIAITNGQPTKSVRFRYDASNSFSVENDAPYSLFGDNPANGDIFAGQFANGSHTVGATPFANSNAGGNAGVAKTITFTVTNLVSRADVGTTITTTRVTNTKSDTIDALFGDEPIVD